MTSPETRGPLAAIVLAAGKGTRMRSARAKVLHELLGRPLVCYPVELARAVGANPVVAVLGHQREAVEAALLARFGPGAVTVVEQAEQRGTGHAVRLAMPALARMEDGLVLVLYGDVPLLRRETLEELVGTARRYGCLALVTATPPDATGYGRILRDERGHVIGVVEQKDASPEERAITEINAGIYCGPADFFREAVLGLGTGNAQGEYYLTDVVARAARSIGVSAIEAPFNDVSGINDRQQLAEAEATLRGRINRALMAHVTFRDPATTVVEPDVADRRRRRAGPQRRAARAHPHRPRRAHRRRLHPDRHGGRCRRASEAVFHRQRGRDRPGRDHRAVRAHASRHAARARRSPRATSSRPRRP